MPNERTMNTRALINGKNQKTEERGWKGPVATAVPKPPRKPPPPPPRNSKGAATNAK